MNNLVPVPGQVASNPQVVQQLAESSRPIKEVTLKNGWKVQLREPDALDMWNISALLNGADPRDPRNVYALAIYSIQSINGQPFRKPLTEAELKGFLMKLGGVTSLNSLIEEANGVLTGEDLRTDLKKE